MTAGNGEGTSNTVLCIVRWIWNWLFKARQKREGQPSITQSAHGLKTEGANSPNIIANGPVTVAFDATSWRNVEQHPNFSPVSDEEKAIQAVKDFSDRIQRDRERKEELEILRLKKELANPHPESYVPPSRGNEI